MKPEALKAFFLAHWPKILAAVLALASLFLQASLKETVKERDALKTTVSEQTTKIEDATQEVSALNVALAKSESRIRELSVQIREAEDVHREPVLLPDGQIAFSETRSTRRDSDTQARDVLQLQLAQASQRIDYAEQRSAMLETSNAVLKEEIRTLEKTRPLFRPWRVGLDVAVYGPREGLAVGSLGYEFELGGLSVGPRASAPIFGGPAGGEGWAPISERTYSVGVGASF